MRAQDPGIEFFATGGHFFAVPQERPLDKGHRDWGAEVEDKAA